jgi:uncharacterized protein with GYD domain
MARFLSTIKFTEQGIKNIQDTCKRANSLKAAAKKMGAKVSDIYWTPGRFDGLIIFDAPDEETATALMLQLGSLGNVRTEMARAYQAAEMESALAKLAK